MAHVDITEKSRPSGGGKRKITILLVAVGVFYAAGLVGLYFYSSGINPITFLFGPEDGPDESLLDRNGDAVLELSLQPPDNDKILPPLDDAPPEESALAADIPLDIHAAAEKSIKAAAAVEPDIAPTPIPGVTFESRMFPIKCWDQRGFEYGAADCDALGELARLAEHHLDMVETCRTENTNSENTGTFALFAEADFVRNSLSIWPGTASSLRDADKIADCITERWRALPFMNVPHQFARYRMKGAVRFTTARRSAAAPIAVTPSRAVELEKAAADAEEVTVSRERVRVRKAPVSGEIIGFISTGQKVKLIEVTDEWCLVKTKRGNLGWMICWGLDLQQPGAAPPEVAPPPKGK